MGELKTLWGHKESLRLLPSIPGVFCEAGSFQPPVLKLFGCRTHRKLQQMYFEMLDHLGHLILLEIFRLVFLDQTLFFLAINESTDSFSGKIKVKPLIQSDISLDLNFEVKAF